MRSILSHFAIIVFGVSKTALGLTTPPPHSSVAVVGGLVTHSIGPIYLFSLQDWSWGFGICNIQSKSECMKTGHLTSFVFDISVMLSSISIWTIPKY